MYKCFIDVFNSADSEQVNGNSDQSNENEESSVYCLSDQKQLLRLSECIKQLGDCYVEVCSNQDVGFKILQTAMQSEVRILRLHQLFIKCLIL